jgi:hypothetical protein
MAKPFLAADGAGTIFSVLLEGPPLSTSSRAAGLRLKNALDAYRRNPSKQYDLFLDEYLVPAGLSSGTAEMDRILTRDLLFLTPWAALFLILVLRLLLGGWRPLLLVLALLAVGTIWSLGLMGWWGTPLSIVTMALVPLILGCGIDYAVLIGVEALDRRAAGFSHEDTLTSIGRSSALAVFLTTLTTAAGLLALLLSDSPGMGDLGFHAACGMGALGVLAIVVLPVFLPTGGRAGLLRMGPVVAVCAEFTRKKRITALLLWSLVTAGGLALVRTPVVSLDMVEGNYPADAPIARSMREMRKRCGGAFPELVIVRGDLSDPRAVQLMQTIKKRITSSPQLGSRFQAIGVSELLSLVELRSLFSLPWGEKRSEAERSRQAVEEAFTSPLLAPFMGLFVDRDLSIGTIMLLGGDAGTDLDGVRRIWDELESIFEEETRPGDPVQFSFLGYRTMAYLFTTYSWKWIRITAGVSLTVVLLLTALFLRRIRAVALVALLMAGSSIWWLGALQLGGIYLSVFLLFPLVFAMCIGSDYGLHLLCSFEALKAEKPEKQTRLSPRERSRSVWSTTGRAIAIAALTDAGVFGIFAGMELVSGSHIMLAVVLAVGAVFASTIILVPALKRLESGGAGR